MLINSILKKSYEAKPGGYSALWYIIYFKCLTKRTEQLLLAFSTNTHHIIKYYLIKIIVFISHVIIKYIFRKQDFKFWTICTHSSYINLLTLQKMKSKSSNVEEEKKTTNKWNWKSYTLIQQWFLEAHCL